MNVTKRTGARTQWTFLTNHAHVLIALAREPNSRVRDLAEMVNITERAVQQILTDLEEARVLTRERDGRRNRYSIDRGAPLRHPNEAGGRVDDLLSFIRRGGSGPASGVNLDAGLSQPPDVVRVVLT
jgi:DNA-binding transcriptional ArsR family regulator